MVGGAGSLWPLTTFRGCWTWRVSVFCRFFNGKHFPWNLSVLSAFRRPGQGTSVVVSYFAVWICVLSLEVVTHDAQSRFFSNQPHALSVKSSCTSAGAFISTALFSLCPCLALLWGFSHSVIFPLLITEYTVSGEHMLNPWPCRHDGPVASMCRLGLPYPPAFAASILNSTLLLINNLFKNNVRFTEKLS